MTEVDPIGSKSFAVFSRNDAFRLPRETIVALAIFAVFWEGLSWVSPPYVIPGWGRIVSSVFSLRLDFVLITLARVAVALLLSFVIGLALAMLMYASDTFERYSKPLVRLLMAVPVVCWVLFSVLWFKGVEFRIAFVLIVTCAPVFIVDCLDGMKGAPKHLREMLRSPAPVG